MLHQESFWGIWTPPTGMPLSGRQAAPLTAARVCLDVTVVAKRVAFQRYLAGTDDGLGVPSFVPATKLLLPKTPATHTRVQAFNIFRHIQDIISCYDIILGFTTTTVLYTGSYGGSN